MKLGVLFPNFKAWSNFRLMLVLGSVATLLTLVLGVVVVQAALSNNSQADAPDTVAETPATEAEGPAGESESARGEAQGGAQAAAPAIDPLPALDSGETFRVSCAVGERTATQTTCQVESFNGFARRVDLSCRNLPHNLRCVFTPSSVVPRANGSTTFRLELVTGQVPPGDYVFDVAGQSGSQVRTFRYPWGLSAPRVAQDPPVAPGRPPPPPAPAAPAANASAEPTFSFACGSLTEGNKVLWSLSRDGRTANINCFLTPLNGFNEPVSFEFSQPDALAKPDTVSFVVDQLQEKKLFDLRFEFGDSIAALTPEQLEEGVDYPFQVTGTSESGKTLTKQVILTIAE